MRKHAPVIAAHFTAFFASCGGGTERLPLPAPEPDPDFPTIELTEAARGFVQPTAITHAGDDSGRLFVAERQGTVRIVDAGVAAALPILDLRDRVTSAGNEQGLLGLAFAPDYAESGHLYVNYTDLLGDTVIARFTADPESDTIDPATAHVVLALDQPFANHNGGQLAFGPDGYLYVGLGDGGSAGDPFGHAQNLESLLGKILRLDVSDPDLAYAIPVDNPYGNEVWAYGLRNPWRFSFDVATGDLYIADVGQQAREEINVQPAASRGGENYGWNVAEGTQCYGSLSCDTRAFTAPVHDYDHGEGCSVTGGYVRSGVYIFGDFCSGRISGLKRDGNDWIDATLLETPFSISTFGVDEDGALYVADFAAGTLYRID